MPSPYVGTAKQAQKFNGLTNFLQLSQLDFRHIATNSAINGIAIHAEPFAL
jgi:hypothetical protein